MVHVARADHKPALASDELATIRGVKTLARHFCLQQY
jgi:hypothetical protein